MKPPPPKIRILIVDDHFVVRMGLTTSINAEADLSVVAEADTGREAIEQFTAHRPDITLLDLRLPGMDGLAVLRALHEQAPEARVIILSSHSGDADIQRSLEAGACSYVLKTGPRAELLEAIRRVHTSGRHIPADVAVCLAERAGRSDLTPRELDVLRGIAHGQSNKEIAAAHGIGEGAVKLHITHLLQKLAAADRTQAALTALRRGIIRLE